MIIQYQAFIENLSRRPQAQVELYLPNGSQVPAHGHLTYIGSIFHH
jgi:hypothetical protein